jgi:hypothetical protein
VIVERLLDLLVHDFVLSSEVYPKSSALLNALHGYTERGLDDKGYKIGFQIRIPECAELMRTGLKGSPPHERCGVLLPDSEFGPDPDPEGGGLVIRIRHPNP